MHVRALGLARAPDPDLVTYARRDARILLAFDLDFDHLLALDNLSAPSVILFRLTDQRPVPVNARLGEILTAHEADLHAGAIVVEDAHVRVRRLPIGR